jgi:cell division protein FtsL
MKMKGNKENIVRKTAPLLRMRHMPGIIAFVAVLVIGPLLVVWKQVYITEVSMKQTALADSLKVLSKETAGLRFAAEKLSSTGRIESIARERLGLEYPAAGQIVIIKQRETDKTRPGDEGNFLAILRRSLSHVRG